jgi:hypothetical protein
MKFHNPFTILCENDNHALGLSLLIVSITLVGICITALALLLKFAPIPTLGSLTLIPLARVMYAVFKGK